MKILVVDDHPLIQQALANALPTLHGPLDVLAAVDRDETRTVLARHPDCALVLLDLTLPGAHGLDLLVELRRDHPHLPIVVLSATHDRATVGAAMSAGARGYIAKTSTPDELLDARCSKVAAASRPISRRRRRRSPACRPACWGSRIARRTCCAC
jgi:DNA-binding NarL/FixJ family response regulator